MSQQNTGPVAIIGGRPYPITATQYALARAGVPMGYIPGAPGMGPAPTAAAPRAAQPKPVNGPAEVARKAAAFDTMMADQYRASHREPDMAALRRTGVDPKALATPGAAPKAAALDGRAMSRASMEKIVRAHGQEPVKR